MSDLALCGRSEAARILEVSETHTRALQRAGAIKPVAIVGNRPLFHIPDIEALRERRAAKRRNGDANAV